MSQALSIFDIGSKATVDLYKVRDRIPKRLSDLLIIDPVGTIVDYKMTDGKGIGVVLILSDGSTSWFFEDELKNGELLKAALSFQNNETNQDKLDDKLILLSNNKNNIQNETFDRSNLIGKGILDLMNPVNFFRWILFSLKDVY